MFRAQTIFRILAIFIFLAVIPIGVPVHASPSATITVNTIVDEYGSGANCSIREAIKAANDNAAFGGCPGGSGADVILLPAGHFDLTSATFGVTSAITLTGAGMDLTVLDCINLGQIFFVSGSASLTLNDLTLENGRAFDRADGATGSSGGIDADGGNGGDGGQGWAGGAILTDNDPLVINRVKFLNNSAGNGGKGGTGGRGGTLVTPGHAPTNGGNGGYGGSGGPGGAIYSASAAVTITDSIFIGNHSGVGGSGGNGGAAGDPVAFSPTYPGDGGNGGIGNYGGPSGSGGAIYSQSGVLTITRSTFQENYTPAGGASGFGGSGANGLGGSALTNYIAGDGGDGGLSESGGLTSSHGGAIYAGGTLVVTDSIFINNAAGAGGNGGIGGMAGNGGTGGNNPGASIPGCCVGGSGGNGGDGGDGGYGGNGGAIHSRGSLTITGSIFYLNIAGEGGEAGDGGTGGNGGVGGNSPDSAPGGNGGNGGRGGNTRHGDGGAIYATGGSVTINESSIYENGINNGGHGGTGGNGGEGGNGGQGLSGTTGGTGGTGGNGGAAGVFLLSGYGGGIYTAVTSGKTVNITNTTISGNTSGESTNGAPGGAGGAGGNGGATTSTPSLGGEGGTGGDGSSANRGSPGGGTFFQNDGGSVSNLLFLTVTNNTAPTSTGTGGPGGPGGQGGLGSDGIQADTGSNGNTPGNAFTSNGGGIYQDTGTVNLKNTLLAANNADIYPDCIGSFTSQDYNLVGVTGVCTIAYQTHDLHDDTASPLNLGPLTPGMGGVGTHAILAGSVALNAIPSGTNGCGTTTTTDQRGFHRPMNGACEIGAFEAGQWWSFLPLMKK